MSLKGGAKAAHAYVKWAQCWELKPTTVAGRVTIAPKNIIENEVSRCTKLWQDDHDDLITSDLLLDPCDRTAPDRLTVQRLREASRSTPARKTTSFDGFHLRHVGLLDDAGITLLALIWEAIELTAILPAQLNALSAPLLMKKNGSLSDIAISHGIIRTCTRARQVICRTWDTTRPAMLRLWRSALCRRRGLAYRAKGRMNGGPRLARGCYSLGYARILPDDQA